jgi:hypothetical protein
MAKKKSIDTIRPKMTGRNQKILIFWCFGQGQFQTMGNAKVVLVACFSIDIIKHPFVPVSPTCNWE